MGSRYEEEAQGAVEDGSVHEEHGKAGEYQDQIAWGLQVFGILEEIVVRIRGMHIVPLCIDDDMLCSWEKPLLL